MAFPTGSRCRGPLLDEHAAGGADRVECVALAAGAAFAPQPADLEHPLTAPGQEARQAGTERAGAFDRERSPARGVPVGELQSVRVAVAARDDRRLEHNRTADDLHDRERMRVAMRIDTHDVVQLICEHPNRPPAQALGDTNRCRSGDGNRGARTVTGHALKTRTGF